MYKEHLPLGTGERVQQLDSSDQMVLNAGQNRIVLDRAKVGIRLIGILLYLYCLLCGSKVARLNMMYYVVMGVYIYNHLHTLQIYSYN